MSSKVKIKNAQNVVPLCIACNSFYDSFEKDFQKHIFKIFSIENNYETIYKAKGIAKSLRDHHKEISQENQLKLINKIKNLLGIDSVDINEISNIDMTQYNPHKRLMSNISYKDLEKLNKLYLDHFTEIVNKLKKD